MLRNGAFIMSPAPLFDPLVTIGDFVILFVVLLVGLKRKNQIIIWLNLAQICRPHLVRILRAQGPRATRRRSSPTI